MADIADQHEQTSPTELDESHGNGNAAGSESRGVKRARPAPADDDDDDDEKGGRERRKIEIKFISDKSRRHITFSKRKAGIMKKVSNAATRRHHHEPVATLSPAPLATMCAARSMFAPDFISPKNDTFSISSPFTRDCTALRSGLQDLIVLTRVFSIGLRAFRPDRHPSPPPRRL